MSFSYDSLGRRTSKTVGGVATQFLYDGANALQETQGTTVNPILTGLGIDERFARNDVTGRTYFLTGALGSTIGLTDTTGALREQYSYDPYGNATQSDTTTGFTNSYQYTGREADTVGLSYYRARYYSPMMGRFISEDPMGFRGGQNNFYAYVGGDPLDYDDPLGLWQCNGSASQCSNFQNGLQAAAAASMSGNLDPEQQASLAASVAAYGAAGDPGVQVNFAEQNSSVGGWTGMNPQTHCETVTFNDENLDNASSGAEAQQWAAAVAHQGQHLVDDAEGSATGYPISRLDSEINAYTNQAYLQQAIVFQESTQDIWTNSGGVNWPMIQIRAAMSAGNTR